jgi:F0F1-type ATP synthase gamma subunit
MQKRSDLKDQDKILSAIYSLATAYQEISVMKMKKARETIDHSRFFVNKLKIVFDTLKASYPLNMKQKNSRQLNSAKVLITASSRLNGDILRKITDLFIKDLESDEADLFVLGKIGQEYLNEYQNKYKIINIEMPENNLNMQNLNDFMLKLLNYKQVVVYYAVFKTVLEQEVLKTAIPSIFSLTDNGADAINSFQQGQDNFGKLYLFEPSGEEIATYLNDTVTTTFIRQTIFETELSKNAARITAMTQLIDKTNQKKNILKRALIKLKREELDKKQNERLMGISFWGSNI